YLSPAPPMPCSPGLAASDEDERDLMGWGVGSDGITGKVNFGTPLAFWSITDTDIKIGVGVDGSLSSYAPEYIFPDASVAGNVYAAWYIHVTLSDPYTCDDLNADLNYLLSQWDLTDDAQYPWRTDKLCTAGPLVGYHEGAPQRPVIHTAGHVNSGATVYDGSILGLPNPAGYDPYFNFRADVFQVETNRFGGLFYLLTGKGEWA